MFRAMGVNWANTMLGCVALVLVPIPLIFIKYGARIRTKSKFAPTPPKAAPHTDEESQ
jgi:MFS transporter, DHA1 family, multidrug resistance protein